MSARLSALREAAEKATPGSRGLTIDDLGRSIPHRVALSPDADPDDEIAVFPSRPSRAFDARFAALCDPAIILALLDVVEAARTLRGCCEVGAEGLGGPYSASCAVHAALARLDEAGEAGERK